MVAAKDWWYQFFHLMYVGKLFGHCSALCRCRRLVLNCGLLHAGSQRYTLVWDASHIQLSERHEDCCLKSSLSLHKSLEVAHPLLLMPPGPLIVR